MRLSVLLVHYHTPELARAAVAALEPALAALKGESEVLIVDNGSDRAGRELLAQLPARVIEAGGNRGYAGGANLGVEHARGDQLLVMNTDVLVDPACLTTLSAALARTGVAVAGPRFFWDRGRRFLLPPREALTRRDELGRVIAQRRPGGAFAARERARWRRHTRRSWEATSPLVSWDLPGAMLLIDRAVWRAVGPFDEGFQLYFEESDWLARLRARGHQALLVPAAEAVHLYDRSASIEPAAGAWFTASEARFQRRHFGATFVALRRAVARWYPAAPSAPSAPGRGLPALAPGRPALELDGLGEAVWVEVSPAPTGFPAAGERVETPRGVLSWSLPAELWERLTPGTWQLRVVDAAGRERSGWHFVREADHGR